MIIQENTIIHGDSLTVLRQMEPESVDAIITDPPYGINYVSQTGASIKNDKSPFIWFLYDAFRVLKSGEAGHGGLICFTRWDVEQTFIDAMKIAGFNVKSEVIWDKVYHGMGDTKAAFAPSHENIVFAVKGKYSFPGSRPKDLVTFPKINSSKMVHPTEKPVGLLANLISSVTTSSSTRSPEAAPRWSRRRRRGVASLASSWMTITSSRPSGASRRCGNEPTQAARHPA